MSKEKTVGQIVAENYQTARVFRSFKLDFCCGGNKTVSEACAEKGVDMKEVETALVSIDQTHTNQHNNYNEWRLDFLIDYIVNNHHAYVRATSPEIRFYLKKVIAVHGSRHREVIEIGHLFGQLEEKMRDHMTKEETVLFPYINELLANDKTDDPLVKRPKFGTAAGPIAVNEVEHEEVGDLMKAIQNLSNDFAPPSDACTTYRLLFQSLEKFQEDLYLHIHLENNILFPKALVLEKQLSLERKM